MYNLSQTIFELIKGPPTLVAWLGSIGVEAHETWIGSSRSTLQVLLIVTNQLQTLPFNQEFGHNLGM